jgi:hypothetical protein
MNLAPFQYLHDGIAEFQGLLHPEELRSVAESAVSYLREHDVRDPIREVDSPITTLLRFANAKYLRYGIKLFGILAEAVSAILFDEHGFSKWHSRLGSIVGEYIPLLSRKGSRSYLPIHMMHLIALGRVSCHAFYLKADRTSLFLTFFIRRQTFSLYIGLTNAMFS